MDTSPRINSSQKRALTYAVIVAVVFGAFFLRRYFSMFVIAGILAYLFMPLYNWLRRRLRSGSAAALTVIASSLAILVPVLIVMALAQQT